LFESSRRGPVVLADYTAERVSAVDAIDRWDHGPACRIVRRHEVFFSAAGAWELAIKTALRRVDLPETPERFIPEHLADQPAVFLSRFPHPSPQSNP